MYEQNFIDMYSDRYLRNILDGKINYIPNINDKSDKSMQLYFSFQHFLIKSYMDGYNKEACVRFLTGMYNDFHAYPHLFADSPLLNNQTLNSLMGDSPYKKKVIEYRDRYYDKNEAYKLYEKEKTTELNDTEKNRLYSNLMHLIYSNNPNHKSIVDGEIRRILNSDHSKLNDAELTFYYQYLSKYAVGNRGYKTHVVVGEATSNDVGFQIHDFIFMSKEFYNKSFAMMTAIICHETRHSVQYHESRVKETRISFDMAQRDLFCKYLNTNDYNSYRANYHYSAIELDAEHHGYWDASVFLSSFGRKDMSGEVKNIRVERYDTRGYYDYMVDSNKKNVPTDTYIVHRMNQIINDHPEEINKYPVLNKFYNVDGSKKGFSTIMGERMHSGIDDRGLYNNYINNGIFEGRLSEININGMDNDTLKKFVDTLADIYRDNVCYNLKAYFADADVSFKGKRFSNEQVIKVTTYKLTLAYRTLSYVNNNFDLLAKAYTGEKISNQNPLFNFIYDFRDFDSSQIKNPIILGDQDLMNKISKFKSLVDEVTNKFNKVYIASRKNDIPSDILNMNVPSSEYGDMLFKDYLDKVIVDKMDGHQEVTINNQKVYVGDLINLYINNVQNAPNMVSDEEGYGNMAM